ncbi:MAG TPA: hypothetical protein VGQ57_18795 [Polyangiaceae bacterium]|jgi:hypothetical protein|nr:hypothetical protein [Polyangiaceae bacterium]
MAPIHSVGLVVLAVLAGCGSSDTHDASPAPGKDSLGGTGSLSAGIGGAQSQAGKAAAGAGGTPTTNPPAGAGGTQNQTTNPPAGAGGTQNQTTNPPGVGGSAAGMGGRGDPPKPSDDGSSPYERECHGDTATCGDVNTLRCLGIRDDATVYGYSCSNPCDSDADCSSAPASGEARAGCVDFVTQKHCLLVCLQGSAMHSCPDGMGCYVYPQTTVGYCLWM